MIFDKLCNANNYYINDRFRAAFKFLETANDLPCGRHEIAEGVFANIMEFNTKSIDETKIEAHKNFVDIQYIASGVETFGYATEYYSIVEEYDSQRDIYFVDANCQYVTASKGEFAIFFPTDYHKPSIGEGSKVKKIVVKVAI